MNKKTNIRLKKWEQGVFALATLWLVGRTLQKYLFWTSTGAFVTSGSWKEYFTGTRSSYYTDHSLVGLDSHQYTLYCLCLL